MKWTEPNSTQLKSTVLALKRTELKFTEIKLTENSPKWTELNRDELNWNEMNWMDLNIPLTERKCIEYSQKLHYVKWSELKLFKSDFAVRTRIALSWSELDWIEHKWRKLNELNVRRDVIKPSEPIWSDLNWNQPNSFELCILDRKFLRHEQKCIEMT